MIASAAWTWVPTVLSQIICTILSILASVGISVYIMNRQFKKQDKEVQYNRQVTQQAATELLAAAKGTLVYFYSKQSIQLLEKTKSMLYLDKLSAINKQLEHISPGNLSPQFVSDFLVDRNILILLEIDLKNKISAIKDDTYNIKYLQELDIPSRLLQLDHTKKE